MSIIDDILRQVRLRSTPALANIIGFSMQEDVVQDIESYLVEEHGYRYLLSAASRGVERQLERPVLAKYLGMRIYFGKLPLNVAAQKEAAQAAIIRYHGEASVEILSASNPNVSMLESHETTAMVAILDDGLILSRFVYPVSTTETMLECSEVLTSWHQRGYPRDALEVSRALEMGIPDPARDSRIYRAMPDLVMLAVRAATEARPQ